VAAVNFAAWGRERCPGRFPVVKDERKIVMKKILAGLVGVISVVGSNLAMATAQDYSGVSTALTTEITGAMPTVLLISGTVLAIGLGLRLVKKAAHM
jgi:hypothetical protein